MYHTIYENQLKEYDKKELKAKVKSLTNRDSAFKEFVLNLILAIVENKRTNIDFQNEKFYKTLFNDLNTKTLSAISAIAVPDNKASAIAKIKEIVASQIQNISVSSESTTSTSEFINNKIDSISNQCYELLEKIKEALDNSNIKKIKQSKNRDSSSSDKPESFDRKPISIDDLDKDTFKSTDLSAANSSYLDDESAILLKNVLQFKKQYLSNVNFSEKLLNNFISLNTYVLKKIAKPGIFSKYQSNYFTKDVKRQLKVSDKKYTSTLNLTNQDKKQKQPLYLTKANIMKIINLGVDKLVDGTRSISRMFNGIGSSIMSYGLSQFKKNGPWGKAFTAMSNAILGPYVFILKLLKGGFIVLKGLVAFTNTVLKLAVVAGKAALNISVFIFKNVLHFANILINQILKLGKLITKIFLNRFTKKAIAAFFLTRTGAYVLGFVSGFIYEKIFSVYEKILNYATDAANSGKSFIESIFDDILKYFNVDLDAALDIFDDTFNTAMYHLHAIIEWVGNIPEWFSGKIADMKRGAAEFGWGIGGSLIGAAVLGPIIAAGIPFLAPIAPFIGAVIGDFVGKKMYKWVTGYFEITDTASSALFRLSQQIGDKPVAGIDSYDYMRGSYLKFDRNKNMDKALQSFSNMPDLSSDRTSSAGRLQNIKLNIDDQTYSANHAADFIAKINNIVRSEIIDSLEKEREINKPWRSENTKGLYKSDYYYTDVPIDENGQKHNQINTRLNGKWINPYGFKMARGFVLLYAGNAYSKGKISLQEYLDILKDSFNLASKYYENTVHDLLPSATGSNAILNRKLRDLFIATKTRTDVYKPEDLRRDDFEQYNSNNLTTLNKGYQDFANNTVIHSARILGINESKPSTVDEKYTRLRIDDSFIPNYIDEHLLNPLVDIALKSNMIEKSAKENLYEELRKYFAQLIKDDIIGKYEDDEALLMIKSLVSTVLSADNSKNVETLLKTAVKNLIDAKKIKLSDIPAHFQSSLDLASSTAQSLSDSVASAIAPKIEPYKIQYIEAEAEAAETEATAQTTLANLEATESDLDKALRAAVKLPEAVPVPVDSSQKTLSEEEKSDE